MKMGGYGLLRITVGMFPNITVDHGLILTVLAVITILYAAVITLRQTDLKRLIAYSSVSHMGLVVLGIGAVGVAGGTYANLGLTGAAMQLFTHGTITGLLFLCVGVLYERTHTRYIPDLGGLAHRMPFLAVAFIIAGLASLGLPGLSGFVSEILVFPWGVQGPPVAYGVRSLRGSHRRRIYSLDDGAGALRSGQGQVCPRGPEHPCGKDSHGPAGGEHCGCGDFSFPSHRCF